MMVEEVRLRNFKSHRDTVLRLGEGINVIVGENGSGKSTLLEAISFALFKDRPEGMRLEELVTKGQREMEVEVSFLSGGNRYRVVRSWGGRSTSRLYRGDGSLLRQRDREVTDEVERITRMNAKLFKSAVYIQQGEIDALLSDFPSERKNMLAKLLGIERIEQAYERMREVLRVFEGEHEALGWVEEEMERHRDRLRALEAEARSLREGLERLEGERRRAEREAASLREMLELAERGARLKLRIERAEAELRGAKQELERIRYYERVLEERRGEVRRYREVEGEVKRVQEALRRAGERRARLSGVLGQVEEYRRSLRRKEAEAGEILSQASQVLGRRVEGVEELRREVELRQREVEELLRTLDERVKALERDAAGAKGQRQEMERYLRELEGAGSRCPVCWSEIEPRRREEVMGEYRRRIEEAEERERRLREEAEECRAEREYLERRERKLTAIGSRVGELERLVGEVEELRQRVMEMEKEAERLRGEAAGVEELEKRYRELERELEALEGARRAWDEAEGYLSRHGGRREELQKRCRELEDSLRRLRRELGEVEERLGGDAGEVRKSLERRHAEADAKLRGLERRIGECRGELERLERERERLEGELEELGAKAERRRRLGEFIALLRRIREAFSRDCLQRDLREEAMPRIEHHTREIFQEFNLPYTELVVSDDLSVSLYGPLGEVSAEMLSGGEKVAVALALRLGIARALAGGAMEMIMLDEPTVHLDAQRRQELVDVVRKLASVPQTVVVTHDWEFEQAADALIVVEKKEGVSEVRVSAPKAEAGYQGSGDS